MYVLFEMFLAMVEEAAASHQRPVNYHFYKECFTIATVFWAAQANKGTSSVTRQGGAASTSASMNDGHDMGDGDGEGASGGGDA